MNNVKSHRFKFLFLINKCILLFNYIDAINQKDILYEIKNFINKLNDIFSNKDFKDSIEKKNKILEILIQYFEKIINEKIYKLLNIRYNDKEKENIINEIDMRALSICSKEESVPSKEESVQHHEELSI